MSDNGNIGGDEINKITKEVIESIINNESYKHSYVGGWNDTIVDRVIQQLISNDSSYKYIVTCAIFQKNGAGLSTKTECYWNNAQDKFYNIRWENKHLHCMVHVFTIPLL